MSGQQIGTVIGGAIGAYYGGVDGAQWGMAIGGYLGGVASPTQINQPHIGDGQAQTSQDGVPIAWIIGTAPVVGNICQSGPRYEVKKTDNGKGSTTEVNSFEAHQSFTVLICESCELRDSTIVGILMVRANGKVVYDVRPGSTMLAESAKWKEKVTFYFGGEDQMADPTMEAITGVGNTPFNRGQLTAVFRDFNRSEYGDSIPTFEWVVVSEGVSTPGTTSATFGVQTDSYTLPSDASGIFSEYQPNYMRANDKGVFVAYADPAHVTGAGTTAYEWAQLDNHLVQTIGSNVDQNGGGYSAGYDLVAAEKKEKWSISNSGGYCQLYRNGAYCRNLVISGDADWWYGEGTYLAEFGGLVWFAMGPLPGGSVYIGSRKSGSSGTIRNRIYKWALDTAPGDYEYLSRSNVVTAGSNWYMHMDRSGLVWTISETEGELIQWDGDLNAAQTYTLPSPITTTLGAMACFGINGGYLFLASDAGSSIEVYELQTWTHVQSIAISGTTDDYNWQIDFNQSSIFLRAGRYVKRIEWAPSCVLSVPEGWSTLPDNAGYAISPAGEMVPICGSEMGSVTSDKLPLSTIVQRINRRGGLTDSDIDVTELASDLVIGYPIARQCTAADALRPLQGCYFFKTPEYDKKIRCIKDGHDATLVIDPLDFIDGEDEEDQDKRRQGIEFPKKMTGSYLDPVLDFAVGKTKAERRSPDVRAIGEVSIEIPVVMDADEAWQVTDKAMKVAWSKLLGTRKFSVPYDYLEAVPSLPFGLDGKRYVVDQLTLDDGQLMIEATYDRQSAVTSNVTAIPTLPPTRPGSTIAGQTIFVAMNLPQLRAKDNVPGMYLAACGVLESWRGALIQMSTDLGATFEDTISINVPSVIGNLTDDLPDSGSSSEPIYVAIYTGELTNATDDQLAAGANGFAIIDNSDLAEIGQFKTQDETTPKNYELSVVTRGELGTVAADHFTGERFVMLNNVYFLPIDPIFAGQTIVFRPVSFGTDPALNTTYSVVFDPGEFVEDGGSPG